MPTSGDYAEIVVGVAQHLHGQLGRTTPVWATGSVAAKAGVPMMVDPYAKRSREALASEIATYRQEVGAGAEVFAHVIVHVEYCPERAGKVGLRALKGYLSAYGSGETAADLGQAGLVAVGSPAQVADVLAWFRSIGVDRLGLNPLLGFLEPNAVHSTVDLLVDEVAPLLDAWAGLPACDASTSPSVHPVTN